MPDLPPLKGTASLDTAPFRRSIQQMQADLRDLAKQSATIRLTADLSAGRDVQRQVRAIRDAVQEAIPSDMQRRISDMFGGFQLGANQAQQSASVFEARAAALRARIEELDRAVRITRADFQAGWGEAGPEEIQQLGQKMRGLQQELEKVGQEARENFGEYSREVQKVANANRLAQVTAAAARGEITRLGLASQVKLGVGSALQSYGGQAGFAAQNLFGFARASDTARIASGLFQKTVQKTGSTSEEAARVVAKLQDTLGVTGDAAREGIRGLLRQGYTLQQAYTALEGAGASALAAGRSAQDGMSGYVDAVTSGTSAMLNQIGVSENLSTFYQRQAKSLGKTVDEMTRQEKVQAELALITAATGDEVGDLTALQSGLGGATNSTTRELDEASKALGEKLVPLAVNGARALTRVLEVFTALPEPVQTTVTLLGASAVAVGILAMPIASLVRGYRDLWEMIGKGRQAGKAIEAAADATQSLNTASKAGAFTRMLQWVDKSPALWQAYRASVLAATGANNLFNASALKMIATTRLAGAVAAGALVAVAAAGAALAAASYKITQDTQKVYADMDAADQRAHEAMMARVQKLIKAGDELSRTRAKILITMTRLGDAERGDLVGVKWTGERIYKPREEEAKSLRSELVRLRAEETLLYTEQQRRASLAPKQTKLTEDQTQALKDLRQELEGRKFELKLTGLSDMQRDLAELGRTFEELRRKVKLPFIVGGKLDTNNPQLQQALGQLDAQQAAEQAALRKRYADEAVKTAKDAALQAQQAELAAMQEGAAKRRAQRQAEIDEINRQAAEKVKALSDFPEQQKEIEAASRREIAARRRDWAQEDAQLARENQKRVLDATRAARDASIAAMADGYGKEEALRKAALDDLRADLAERARLEQDPGVRQQLQSAGQQQVLALIAQQARERVDAIQQAEDQIRGVQRSARDTTLAAMQDGYAKEVAVRQAALSDLRESLTQQLGQFKGTEEQRARFVREGNRQILALYGQQQQELRKIRQDATRTVTDAETRARSTEIAAIRDETARKRAARQEDLRSLQEQTRKTLETFQGTEAERQRILDAARREQQAKQQQWDQEDERDARERARRLAQAWAGVADAQVQAQAAGRGVDSARFELGLARRLAAARNNALEVARIEGQAARERARLAEQAAQEQGRADRERLARERDLALDADDLSAGDRKAIWARYYADLSALGAKEHADATQRLQQREEQERAAAEAMRQARIQAANRPVEQSRDRQQQLEWARDLSRSDAEVLAINRQISAERAGQIAALRGQLDGANGVKLTAEERRQVEGQIASLQHDQTVSLREQEDQQQALRQSTLDRLDAEAQLAERLARTEADRVAAQRQQLAVAQLRVRELDTQIAGEGREQERNSLIAQRLGLLGQIADLQDKIAAAPLDAEQRRLDLDRAQAQAQLALRGLGEDRVAQAQLSAQVAARELLLANQRVAAARTELELQAALVGQAQARGALAQALTAQALAGREAARQAEDLDAARAQSALESTRQAEDFAVAGRQAAQEAAKRQLDLENALWDASEARARALLQIRGMGEDAVASAEQELALTRERLALTERQLGQENLSPEARADVLKTRLALLGQQAEGERKLLEARRAQRDLAEGLRLAEGQLNREMEGGSVSTRRVEEATRKVAEARATLARAERDYTEARADYERIPSSANAERLRSATEGLTGAIRGQREAISGLAGEYRSTISQMDGVRDAAARLRQVAYGEGGQPFDSRRERDRLTAITARRDAAQRELAEALRGGQADLIQKAAEELARQEERYKKQADLLDENGVQFTRTGERTTQRLADQVDALGIQYDREAVLLEQRAKATDQEAQAAATFSTGVDRFADSTAQLVGALERTYQDLTAALRASAAGRAADAGRQNVRREEDYAQGVRDRARQDQRREEDAAGVRVVFPLEQLDALAGRLAGRLATAGPPQLPPLTFAPSALTDLSRSLAQTLASSLAPPRALTAPPAVTTITHNYGDIHITQQPGESADAVASRVIAKLEDRARRSGRRC